MRTISFQYLLVGQKTRLQIEIGESEKNKSVDMLSSGKNLVMKIRCILLKTLCETLWNVHLLRTALFVTKTPLTTLKSLSSNYFNPALVKDVKEKIFKAIKETICMLESIQDALVGDLI